MFDFGDKVDPKYSMRREVVFLFLSGLFLGSLTMLNIIGISRVIDLSFTLFGVHVPFKMFVGILPYPITFLVTDFVSELYGKKRANLLVWTGLFLNFWVFFIMWVGGILPPYPTIIAETGLPPIDFHGRGFFEIRKLTFGAITASMIAYLTAQFVDVQVFHFLKRLTKGKMLWLRNNGSTLTSQMVDSVSVVLVTYYLAHALPVDPNKEVFGQLMVIILSSYVFKMTSALLDTIPFYIGVKYLAKYLNIDMTYKEE